LLIGFSACREEEDIPPPAPISYTTLIYMVADNDMDSQVDYTLDQLKAGARHSAGTVAVYLDRKAAPPRLFSITQGGEEKPLKTYEEGNSASAVTLADVVSDVKTLVPAEKFALVLWSHGTGWLPTGHSSARSSAQHSSAAFPQTRYVCFDQDGGNGTSFNVMEIDALADALPDGAAEYIWFDACLMANVETFYELRAKCRYLVASPTEVLSEASYDASGIPYSKVLPGMFGGKDDLQKACGYYMAHYRGMRYSILRSASITLVDAGELDSLYRATQTLLRGRLSSVADMDTDGIQAYHTSNEPNVFFDLGEILKKAGSLSPDYPAFTEQLARTVLYKDATETFIDVLTVHPSKCSGLSMYLPLSKWKNSNEYRYYFSALEWADVY
jgi:hypothetical protein